MVIFLAISAGAAAIINSGLVGGSPGNKRFAVLLLGTTVAMSVLMTVWFRTGRSDRTEPEGHPAPIPFRDGRFEITPHPQWDRSKVEFGHDMDLVQIFSVSHLSIDVVPWTKPEPILAALPHQAWLDAIAPFNGRIAWGPEPLTTGSLPAFWAGFKREDESGREGIVALLAAEDALLVVLVMGSDSEFANRRAEIDQMIASVRPRQR